MRANRLGLLELLLESAVCTQVVPSERRQTLLNRLLSGISRSHTADAVRLVTAHGACINTLEPGQVSYALTQAARTGDLALVEAIVQDGAFTVGTRVFNGALEHSPELIVPFIGYGCRPVDAEDCLHRPVAAGRLQTVDMWLQHGFVDVDARDFRGQTALMLVDDVRVGVSPVDIAQRLLEYGASVTAKDGEDRTPVHHAIGCGNPGIIRLFRGHGVDAD